MVLAVYGIFIVFFLQTQMQFVMQSEQQILKVQVIATYYLESANTYISNVKFDEESYPLSKNQGHGVGTIRIVAFVKKKRISTYSVLRTRKA